MGLLDQPTPTEQARLNRLFALADDDPELLRRLTALLGPDKVVELLRDKH